MHHFKWEMACLVRSLLNNPSIFHEQNNIGVFREVPETTKRLWVVTTVSASLPDARPPCASPG